MMMMMTTMMMTSDDDDEDALARKNTRQTKVYKQKDRTDKTERQDIQKCTNRKTGQTEVYKQKDRTYKSVQTERQDRQNYGTVTHRKVNLHVKPRITTKIIMLFFHSLKFFD